VSNQIIAEVKYMQLATYL